jgi:trigger factor
LFVNVTVENLAPCKKLLRVEVEAAEVDKALEAATLEFQRSVRLPGFRPGKAPRHLVAKIHCRDIEEETKRRLVSEAYRDAIKQQKLHVVANPDIEEIQFGRGQPLQFATTVETAPEFELPEYKGLAAKRELVVVTDEDVERALLVLRDQRAAYNDVARPIQSDDYVVVNMNGTCDGKPITEAAPTARGLAEKKKTWIHVAQDSFLPGFTEQLVGAQKGENRAVNVVFPANFSPAELAGKPAVFDVEILEVKEKALPEADDAFAQAFGAENAAKLREGVRQDLQNELNYKQKRAVREQLIKAMVDQVTCELPESMVSETTRSVVFDLVRENTQRGIAKEAIDAQKDQIFAYAANSAKQRVKVAFVLGRIADKESIGVDDREVSERIIALAQQNNIKPERLVKQLQERDGIGEVRDQILTSKVLDFLELHAKIEDVLPTAAPQA